MDIGFIRDLIIIITGVLILLMLIIGAILSFQLYRAVKTLNNTVRNTINTGKRLASEASRAVKNSQNLINLVKNMAKNPETKPPA